jgi:pimeloyl-ACP methyl ester carboxylesterase
MKGKSEPRFPNRETIAKAALATLGSLAAAAAAVVTSARRSERAHRPRGRYVDVSGVKVHYLENGSGPPIVLLHGNALSSEDFAVSGMIEHLAQRHRVIAFDRPGFGRTTRPRGTDWTPERQAALVHAALGKLGVARPTVVGHSLGSLVTVALGIAYPQDVGALVLLSGYYFPSVPLGLPLFAIPALPVVSDIMRFTLWPAIARLSGRGIARLLFAPSAVTKNFERYPFAMSRRPSQIRATVEDAKFMEPAARELSRHYRELTMPIEILSGDGDKIVNSRNQSERLARELPNARAGTIEGAGHMIHYIAPERVYAAIDSAEQRALGFAGTSENTTLEASGGFAKWPASH